MLEADTNQLNCLADLMLIAFMECLATRETSISLTQLHTRNFAPNRQATRDCIRYLLKRGRIEIYPFINKRGGGEQIRDTRIILNIAHPDVPKHILKLSFNMRNMIVDTNSAPFISILDEQLKVYECIEYCGFYLDKEGLRLREDPIRSYKLQLMIMELAHEQVIMVLWRAVKSASTFAQKKKREFVTLNELCDLAYKYFLGYRKRNVEIDFYRIPDSVGNSSLRGVISKYQVG